MSEQDARTKNFAFNYQSDIFNQKAPVKAEYNYSHKGFQPNSSNKTSSNFLSWEDHKQPSSNQKINPIKRNENIEQTKPKVHQNFESKLYSTEPKQKIENEHEIELKKKELEQEEKMKEYEKKSKIDKDNYELTILRNQNKTELEENELKKYLEQQEKKIENEKKQELLKNQYSLEERFMEQQIDAQQDEMLLQMMAANMMVNNQMNNSNHY